MEKLFEIKEKYTIEEHLKFNYAIFLKRKSVKIYSVILLLALVLGIYTKTWNLIVLVAVIPFVLVFSVNYSAKRNYNSNKALKDIEFTIEFYESEIVQKADVGSYKLEHDKISKIIETKRHFYIMASANQGIIIPKSEISNELEEHIRNIKDKQT